MAQAPEGDGERTQEPWYEEYRRVYPGPIRLRPAMYIGTCNLRELVLIALMNAVSAVAGQEDAEVSVSVSASGDQVAVGDNRRQVQPGDAGAPWGELVDALRVPLAFGPRRQYRELELLNALCEHLVVRICRDSEAREQHFSQGFPQGAVVTAPCADGPTVWLVFRPDPLISTEEIAFDEAMLLEWLQEQAALRPGLCIHYHGEGSGLDRRLCYPGGLRDYVAEVNAPYTGAYPDPPFACEGTACGIRVNVALQYTDRAGKQVMGFAHNERKPAGGTHVQGFRAALARELTAAAQALGIGPIPADPLFAFYLRGGLTAAVSVSEFCPSEESATGDYLMAPEAEPAVSEVFGRAFRAYLAAEPVVARRIVSRALKAWYARPWWLRRVPLEAEGRAGVRRPFLDAAFFVLRRHLSTAELVLHTRFPREPRRRCRRVLDRAGELASAAWQAMWEHEPEMCATWLGDLAAQTSILTQLRRQCPGFRCSTYRRALHWVYYQERVRHMAPSQPADSFHTSSPGAWSVLTDSRLALAALYREVAMEHDRRDRPAARRKARS